MLGNRAHNLLLCILFLSGSANGQWGNPTLIGLGVERTQYLYKSGTGMYLFADVPVSDKIALHYSAGLGFADKTGIYGHIPLSVAVGIVASAAIGGAGIELLPVLVGLIPEGISVSVKKTNPVDFRLVLNPLTYFPWDSEIEESDPVVPQIGALFFVKNKKGNPLLRLSASFLYQIPNGAPGVMANAAVCIPIR